MLIILIVFACSRYKLIFLYDSDEGKTEEAQAHTTKLIFNARSTLWNSREKAPDLDSTTRYNVV